VSGYVPVFSSLTSGTLYGRWPDIGLWPIVLSLSDRHGHVDVTHEYIAGVTGLAVSEVIACMRRFCAPDPGSRSSSENGARLVLLDSHRDWGWRIVNHGFYREKARKQMQQVAATDSGRDAERKRLERERAASGDVRRSPALTGPQTQTQTQTQNKDTTGRSRDAARPRLSDDELKQIRGSYPWRAGSNPWPRARKAIDARVREGVEFAALLAGAQRYEAWVIATGKMRTELVMQAARFFGPDREFEQAWEVGTDVERKRASGAALEAWSMVLGECRKIHGTKLTWQDAAAEIVLIDPRALTAAGGVDGVGQIGRAINNGTPSLRSLEAKFRERHSRIATSCLDASEGPAP
jgi:hypothetical protein